MADYFPADHIDKFAGSWYVYYCQVRDKGGDMMPEELLRDQSLIEGTVELEEHGLLYRGRIAAMLFERGSVLIATNGIKRWDGAVWSDFGREVMSFAASSASLSTKRSKGAYHVSVQYVGTFKLYPRNTRLPEIEPITTIRRRTYVH